MAPIDTPAVPIVPCLRKSLRLVVLVLIRIRPHYPTLNRVE